MPTRVIDQTTNGTSNESLEDVALKCKDAMRGLMVVVQRGKKPPEEPSNAVLEERLQLTREIKDRLQQAEASVVGSITQKDIEVIKERSADINRLLAITESVQQNHDSTTNYDNYADQQAKYETIQKRMKYEGSKTLLSLLKGMTPNEKSNEFIGDVIEDLDTKMNEHLKSGRKKVRFALPSFVFKPDSAIPLKNFNQGSSTVKSRAASKSPTLKSKILKSKKSQSTKKKGSSLAKPKQRSPKMQSTPIPVAAHDLFINGDDVKNLSSSPNRSSEVQGIPQQRNESPVFFNTVDNNNRSNGEADGKKKCHHCRKSKMRTLLCNDSSCEERYCTSCLITHYNLEDWNSTVCKQREWVCPKCEANCQCANCLFDAETCSMSTVTVETMTTLSTSQRVKKCHQCDIQTSNYPVCQEKNYSCKKAYCESCLKTNYSIENVQDIYTDGNAWSCPFCLKLCNCSKCCQKNQVDRTSKDHVASGMSKCTAVSAKKKPAKATPVARKCHHCLKQSTAYAQCTYWHINGKQCKYYYCGKCLKTVYNVTDIEVAMNTDDWQCPSCLGHCVCAACEGKSMKGLRKRNALTHRNYGY